MNCVFLGSDNGIFAFGRAILRQSPKSDLEFHFCLNEKKEPKKIKSQEFFSESDFWERGLSEILKKKTRFGRIGIVYDRKNTQAKEFLQNLDISAFEYSPQQKRTHTKKIPEIFVVETQILKEMANEGFSDTVEFRRLSRKFLRNAKHAQTDTLFFLENIFSEEKTQSILSHIAGSQQSLFFPVDFLPEEVFSSTSSKQSIRISFSGESQEFLQNRAEQILKKKLSKNDFSEEAE